MVPYELNDEDRSWRDQNVPNVSDDDLEKIFEVTGKGEETDTESEKEKEKEKTKIEIAIKTAKENTQKLFLDEYDVPSVALPVEDHLETLPINSKKFKNWCKRTMYLMHGIVMSNQSIDELCDLLCAETQFSPDVEQIPLSLRTASFVKNNQLEWYYDLTNKNWEFVKITSGGWHVIKNDILFRRYGNHEEQVHPSTNYEPEIFDRFMKLVNINQNDEETKLQLKVYIITLLIPDIQKPVLMLHGPQGAAKSFLEELIKMLVDPGIANTFTFPTDKNELIQQLSHNHVVYYDNISGIKEWISDQFCRAVSGSGSSKRQLWTDDEDIIRSFKRCIGFNGINLGAAKADLLDRGLIIKLDEIDKKKRLLPKTLWDEFYYLRPYLLGYIFDILVKVLNWKNNLNGSPLNLELPRMAEFAEYGEMISRCMGNPDNAFIKAYNKNIESQSEEIIETSQIALCLRELMFEKYCPDNGDYKEEWRGTPSALYGELEAVAPTLNINTRSKYWPKNASSLGRRLNEIIPSLKSIGLEIDRDQDGKKRRIIIIRKLPSVPPLPSETDIQTRVQSDFSDSRDRRDGNL